MLAASKIAIFRPEAYESEEVFDGSLLNSNGRLFEMALWTLWLAVEFCPEMQKCEAFDVQ